MTSGSSPIPTKGPVMPALAISALVLAVLVWIVPLPILRAPQPPPPPPEPVVETPKPAVEAPKARVEEWVTLASSLEGLREKAPESPAPDPAATKMAEAPVTPIQTVSPLGWQFKGTIDGPGSSAALVTLADGRSRFVFVGQHLPDPSNPEGPWIVIREIASDHMVVSRGETEESLPLQKPELANPLSGRVSASGMGR
ncbi:MAG: hypothetical protein JNK58_00335 [Phycisphaerae bacterium]|nr:hypothetical protein [Phycisphaerae bacterium]